MGSCQNQLRVTTEAPTPPHLPQGPSEPYRLYFAIYFIIAKKKKKSIPRRNNVGNCVSIFTDCYEILQRQSVFGLLDEICKRYAAVLLSCSQKKAGLSAWSNNVESVTGWMFKKSNLSFQRQSLLRQGNTRFIYCFISPPFIQAWYILCQVFVLTCPVWLAASNNSTSPTSPHHKLYLFLYVFILPRGA